MKKYMLITLGDFGQFVSFYDDYIEAENARMNAECCMGHYAELYYRGRENPEDPDWPYERYLPM